MDTIAGTAADALFTVGALRDFCRDEGLWGYSGLNKGELVALIFENGMRRELFMTCTESALRDYCHGNGISLCNTRKALVNALDTDALTPRHKRPEPRIPTCPTTPQKRPTIIQQCVVTQDKVAIGEAAREVAKAETQCAEKKKKAEAALRDVAEKRKELERKERDLRQILCQVANAEEMIKDKKATLKSAQAKKEVLVQRFMLISMDDDVAFD
eukprot:m51a1_g6351 hypothetical protein (214) ;mRNA; f:82215-82947